jgi:hypothetical protein
MGFGGLGCNLSDPSCSGYPAPEIFGLDFSLPPGTSNVKLAWAANYDTCTPPTQEIVITSPPIPPTTVPLPLLAHAAKTTVPSSIQIDPFRYERADPIRRWGERTKNEAGPPIAGG